MDSRSSGDDAKEKQTGAMQCHTRGIETRRIETVCKELLF